MPINPTIQQYVAPDGQCNEQNVIKTGKESKKILSENCQLNTNIRSMKKQGA